MIRHLRRFTRTGPLFPYTTFFRSRRADAGRGQHALSLDLHHAGAAVAVGAIARLRLVAEMRDLRPGARGGLPDGLARLRLDVLPVQREADRSEEHTSELQSLMRISYAVFCLKNKQIQKHQHTNHTVKQDIK